MPIVKIPPDVDPEAFRDALLRNLTGKTVLLGAQELASAVERGAISLEAAEKVLALVRPYDSED